MFCESVAFTTISSVPYSVPLRYIVPIHASIAPDAPMRIRVSGISSKPTDATAPVIRFADLAVTNTGRVSPTIWPLVGLLNVMVTPGAIAPVTMTTAAALASPLDATMTDVPGVTAATSPAGETVATVPFVEDHVTARSVRVSPAASSVVAVNWTVSPGDAPAAGGVTQDVPPAGARGA